MISIDLNNSPFGITSSSNFLVNFMGSIPLIGVVVGMERIRAAALARPKETEVCHQEKNSSFQTTAVYATEHCFRAVFEIIGAGSLLFITELVCKILGFLVRLIGHILLAATCCVVALLLVAGFFLAYLLYGVVKLIAKAIPLYEPLKKPVLTKSDVLEVFSSLAVGVSDLIWKSSEIMMEKASNEEKSKTLDEEKVDDFRCEKEHFDATVV